MQKLARPFLHEIREYHLSLKDSKSSPISGMIPLGIYADVWGALNQTPPPPEDLSLSSPSQDRSMGQFRPFLVISALIRAVLEGEEVPVGPW